MKGEMKAGICGVTFGAACGAGPAVASSAIRIMVAWSACAHLRNALAGSQVVEHSAGLGICADAGLATQVASKASAQLSGWAAAQLAEWAARKALPSSVSSRKG